MQRTKVIIDCDPGCDDAMALMLALFTFAALAAVDVN